MSVELNQNESDLESLNSDCTLSEDEFDLSTDQTRIIPVVNSKENFGQDRIFKQYIDRFQTIIRDNQTSSVDLTKPIDNENPQCQGEFRLSYNRTQILKSGYPILSNETFPFYSLCYLVRTFDR